MINPDLLRSLGWSDDLISEVNRVAETVERQSGTMPPVEGASALDEASATAIYVDPARYETGKEIPYKPATE